MKFFRKVWLRLNLLTEPRTIEYDRLPTVLQQASIPTIIVPRQCPLRRHDNGRYAGTIKKRSLTSRFTRFFCTPAPGVRRQQSLNH
ncbi:MAG: hypothetical protein LBE79_13575 [Tannerella sp.]|jgi:hypothetical protein|nr:hypothetical protein [Tannerella sp.]